MFLLLGDRYGEDPKPNNNYSDKQSELDEIDEWDNGKKSVAQEVLGKAKEIWNKTTGGYDETEEYG